MSEGAEVTTSAAPPGVTGIVDIYEGSERATFASAGPSPYSPGIVYDADSGYCQGYGDFDPSTELVVSTGDGTVMYEQSLGSGQLMFLALDGPLGDENDTGGASGRFVCRVEYEFDGADDGDYEVTLDGEPVGATLKGGRGKGSPVLATDLNQEPGYDERVYRDLESRSRNDSFSSLEDLSPDDLRNAIIDLNSAGGVNLLSPCALQNLFDVAVVNERSEEVRAVFVGLSEDGELPTNGSGSELVHDVRFWCNEIQSSPPESDTATTIETLPGRPAPPGVDQEFDHAWNVCAGGDSRGCDDLFLLAPMGSVYRRFGIWCGMQLEIDEGIGCAESAWVESDYFTATG